MHILALDFLAFIAVVLCLPLGGWHVSEGIRFLAAAASDPVHRESTAFVARQDKESAIFANLAGMAQAAASPAFPLSAARRSAAGVASNVSLSIPNRSARSLIDLR